MKPLFLICFLFGFSLNALSLEKTEKLFRSLEYLSEEAFALCRDMSYELKDRASFEDDKYIPKQTFVQCAKEIVGFAKKVAKKQAKLHKIVSKSFPKLEDDSFDLTDLANDGYKDVSKGYAKLKLAYQDKESFKKYLDKAVFKFESGYEVLKQYHYGVRELHNEYDTLRDS